MSDLAQSSPGRGGGSRAAADGGGGSLRRPAVYVARCLRQELSLPEVLLWQRLKGSPMGVRFRKQHPIDPYVVDFYAPSARLVVEVDGEAHDRGRRLDRDLERTAFLESKGYRVVRIAARDVLADADSVAESVFALSRDPLHHPADGPPPRAGEDL